MARPREFDRNAALETAMQLFWRHGYEGVSLADLTAAMAISAPSFYAAFASKAELYRETLTAYQSRPRAFSVSPLDTPLPVREAIEQLLKSAVHNVTELSPSPGCMISTGLLAVAPDHAELAALTATLRGQLLGALQARFERAVREGELTAGARPRALARYFAAVIQGISVQARDAASRNELNGIVALALEALPRRTRGRPREAEARNPAAAKRSPQLAARDEPAARSSAPRRTRKSG